MPIRCACFTPKLWNWGNSSRMQPRPTQFCHTPGSKKRCYIKICKVQMQSRKPDTPRFDVVASKLLEMDTNTSGSIHAASTKAAARNYPRPSIRCMSGIKMQKPAMHILQTSNLPTNQYRNSRTYQDPTSLSRRANGSREGGHSRSSLHPLRWNFTPGTGSHLGRNQTLTFILLYPKSLGLMKLC
jgi:hypothetical protein